MSNSNLNLKYFLENRLNLGGVVFLGTVDLSSDQLRHYIVHDTEGETLGLTVKPCQLNGGDSEHPKYHPLGPIGISKSNHWEDQAVRIPEGTKRELVRTGRFTESDLESL